MNILLVAINAKYIHANLAVYSLKANAEQYHEYIKMQEFTINHRVDFILQEIYKKKPDVVCFSCYIWNFRYICELVRELSMLLPGLPIWVGGPEVSYEGERFLQDFPMVKGIMIGEGEATFLELCEHYVCHQEEPDKERLLEAIPGLLVRGADNKIIKTSDRLHLLMDGLSFCYQDLTDFKHRIIYYESSRGCPFACRYCLSSIDRGLRFKSIEKVQQELSHFLAQGVPQVKFVDRTFNCNHAHAMAIWEFIKSQDNGVTNYHFEISADLLTEAEITLLNSMRPGLVQLEIGVQSVNPKTLMEIKRTMNLKKLEEAVQKIAKGGKIHQHLDLIAGLPGEDFKSFQKSFDRVFLLHPEQLQLGFLKVLKGSYMYQNRDKYGLLFHQEPPYEVLATNWLSYDELLEIKLVEEMLEVYYNSGQFPVTMKILELAFESPFALYWKLGRYYEQNGLLAMQHTRMRRSEILLEFAAATVKDQVDLFQEALTFDLYLRENMKSRPPFAVDLSLFKEQIRRLGIKGTGRHAEPFCYDFLTFLEGEGKGLPSRQEQSEFYLFSYQQRNPLTNQAKVCRSASGKGDTS